MIASCLQLLHRALEGIVQSAKRDRILFAQRQLANVDEELLYRILQRGRRHQPQLDIGRRCVVDEFAVIVDHRQPAQVEFAHQLERIIRFGRRLDALHRRGHIASLFNVVEGDALVPTVVGPLLGHLLEQLALRDDARQRVLRLVNHAHNVTAFGQHLRHRQQRVRVLHCTKLAHRRQVFERLRRNLWRRRQILHGLLFQLTQRRRLFLVRFQRKFHSVAQIQHANKFGGGVVDHRSSSHFVLQQYLDGLLRVGLAVQHHHLGRQCQVRHVSILQHFQQLIAQRIHIRIAALCLLLFCFNRHVQLRVRTIQQFKEALVT
mmetsp:Transcript_11062/g.16739  ORF Transcript_11062/g.16739 Transcript_11062/m.16739 type:complete len:319 (+) Transcript_11062:1091-2047(+)